MITERVGIRFASLAIALGLFAAPVMAAPIEIAQIKHDGDVDFEKEILPVLRKKCLACHNATEAESDLVLETPQSILKGGGEGPSVVAGKSMESLLLKVSSHASEPVMPPEDNDVGAKPMTPEELALLKLWIDQGAKGSVSGESAAVQWQSLPPGVNPTYAVAVSPDGQYIAAGRANQIFIYHLPSKREIVRLTDPELLKSGVYDRPGVAHLDLVQSLAFSPDSTTLASSGYRTVKLWQRPDSVRVADVAGIADALSVAVDAKGAWAAYGQKNGEIKLVDLATNKVAKTLKHSGAITGVAFSIDGAKLVSGSQDKTFQVWNVADGKQLGIALEAPAEVNAVAFVGPAETAQIATGLADNKILIWDLPPDAKPEEAIAPVREIPGHTGPIHALAAFPNDPNQLASGSQDGTARIWTVSTGAQAKSLNHAGPVLGVAVRGDGQRLVSVSDNNSIKLWDVAKGTQMAEVKGDYRDDLRVEGLTRAAALAKRMVDVAKKDLDEGEKRKKAEEDNAKKAEEAVVKAAEEKKKKEEAAVKPVADKTEADKVLAEKTTALAKAEEAQKKATEAHAKAEEELKAATTDRDGKEGDAKAAADKIVEAKTKTRDELAAAKKTADDEFNKINTEFKAAEAKVKQTEAPAKKAEDELTAATRAHDAAVRSVERSKESIKTATDAIPGFQKIVEQAEKDQTAANEVLEQAKKMIPEHQLPVRAVAFSPDGAIFATVGDDQVVHTWDSESGAAVEVREGQGAVQTLIAFAGNGDMLSYGANNTLVRWAAQPEWGLVRTIGGMDSDAFVDRVTALDFSNDGKLLATGGGEPSRSGELKIWNVADGKLVREIVDAHSDTVFSVQFSPDDQSLASSAADRFMKIHQVADGKFVRSFEGHTHHVLGVAWSADGLMLATGGADMVIKVWDFRTGDQSRTIQGFTKEITSVEFVADTTTLVASCGDKNVHMKRADNGGNVRALTGGADYMYSACSTADGKLIVAGGYDSNVRVWQDTGTSFMIFAPPAPPADEQTASTAADGK
ncbi:c-type cytochrome domain-containing protein [Lignipirellula cremea]|uniref:Chromosome partition protein Smc n=1 Tax=Lignipirellula cremea TaxID=2528010 RepID=A0A518DZB1_9BACT|nr:c-type cytochrome domain-containing protein [Lignipirellula cremea]QDU97172.1 Chromosome partition protein Smc [Lignipirellula cremea]